MLTVAVGPNNEWVHVAALEDVPPEHRPRCHCPACAQRLVARIGRVRAPHFAHRPPSKCYASLGGEGVEHLDAKLRLAAHLTDLAASNEAVRLSAACPRCHQSLASTTVPLQPDDRVEVEATLGGRRPDLVVRRAGALLLVIEIAVRNPCSNTRWTDLRALAPTAAELRASAITRLEPNLTLVCTRLANGEPLDQCVDCNHRAASIASSCTGIESVSAQVYVAPEPRPQRELVLACELDVYTHDGERRRDLLVAGRTWYDANCLEGWATFYDCDVPAAVSAADATMASVLRIARAAVGARSAHWRSCGADVEYIMQRHPPTTERNEPPRWDEVEEFLDEYRRTRSAYGSRRCWVPDQHRWVKTVDLVSAAMRMGVTAERAKRWAQTGKIATALARSVDPHGESELVFVADDVERMARWLEGQRARTREAGPDGGWPF